MERTTLLLCLLLSACGATPTRPDEAPLEQTLLNRDHHRVALLGHDPVAYFTDGRPVPGDPAITAEHHGAIYRFASEEHRALFLGDPEHYAPQFGGYCGYAASIGRLSPVDPSLFQILDGRLVLQHSPPALALWNQDVQGNLQRADGHWPGLLRESSHPVPLLTNTDETGLALGGHDPMSYRTGTPTLGDPANVGNHDGATYRFASRESRYAFEDHAGRNAPAFGSFCAMAVAEGRLVPSDPLVFELVDDRLLFFQSQGARERFDASRNDNLRRADESWPRLVRAEGH